MKTRTKVILAITATVFVGSLFVGPGAGASPPPVAKAPPNSDPALPPHQKALLAAVETGRSAYAAGKNEMAKGAARPIRSRAICSSLGSGLSIYDWIGTVSTLSSNGDGKGVLAIEIGRNIFVKTWNNAL